jgi:hypothetical protein
MNKSLSIEFAESFNGSKPEIARCILGYTENAIVAKTFSF